jgi:FtsP/CotA-like multicopper oxidase with cupredoxin domain
VLDIDRSKRYRLRLRNATDDIHPLHLHRHTFEVTHIAGTPTQKLHKDVVMLGDYQSLDFTSPPTSQDCPCSTATSSSTWTTAP